MGHHRVVAEEQGPAEGQVLPVVTLPEGGEECVGVGRARDRTRWCPVTLMRAVASSGVQTTGGMATVWHRRCRHRPPPPAPPARIPPVTWKHVGDEDRHHVAGLQDAPGHARRLEDLGVDGAFTFEGPHDVFTPLVLASGATSTLELATNVAIAFPRNPVQLAHQAYDLQLLSEGRFTLGLGSQIRAQVEKRYGASFDRPIARMRELVGALRAIFATWETGERLDFRGEFTSHTLMPPMFNPGPNPFGMPPIAIGGLGPQMVRLAAEVADGLLVMPFNSVPPFPHPDGPGRGRGSGPLGPGAVGADASPVRSSCAAGATRTRWRRPGWPVAGSFRSTLPRRPTGRCSRWRGGRTSSPSSTRCPSPADGRRCPP